MLVMGLQPVRPTVRRNQSEVFAGVGFPKFGVLYLTKRESDYFGVYVRGPRLSETPKNL